MSASEGFLTAEIDGEVHTYPFSEADGQSAMALAIAREHTGRFGCGETFAEILAGAALDIAQAKAQLGLTYGSDVPGGSER